MATESLHQWSPVQAMSFKNCMREENPQEGKS